MIEESLIRKLLQINAAINRTRELLTTEQDVQMEAMTRESMEQLFRARDRVIDELALNMFPTLPTAQRYQQSSMR